jgi:hypothetical protein
MKGIPLFIAEPTGRCRLVLRRFCYGRKGHSHDASAVIGEDEPVTQCGPDGVKPVTDGRIPHDDPRWPRSCACGEPFSDSDEWQVNELDWYEGGGHRFCWGIGSWNGPPGAMVKADWRDVPESRPPSYIVFLPNGAYWCTNDRASGPDGTIGPYWDVTGTAPDITVSPSIDDRDPARPWHGWIRSGMLERAG